MPFRIMAVAITAMLLWGCGVPTEEPETAAPPAPAGESTEAAAGPATDTESLPPPLLSETIGEASGPEAGTVEDFEVNVGDRVLFGTDRFDLSDEAREVLRKQSQWLNQYPGINVTIAGHADERGTREYNLALGERRAISVKNYLVALGVDSRRIRTISYGKERPVDAASNEQAWAKNRRGVTQIERASLSLSN